MEVQKKAPLVPYVHLQFFFLGIVALLLIQWGVQKVQEYKLYKHQAGYYRELYQESQGEIAKARQRQHEEDVKYLRAIAPGSVIYTIPQ